MGRAGSVARLPYIHYMSGRKADSLTSPPNRIIACAVDSSTFFVAIVSSELFLSTLCLGRAIVPGPLSCPLQYLCCPSSWPHRGSLLRLTMCFSRHRHHIEASVKDVQMMRCRSWPQEHKSRLWLLCFPTSFQSTRTSSFRSLIVKSSLFSADLRQLRTVM